jgi:hypothetical protein
MQNFQFEKREGILKKRVVSEFSSVGAKNHFPFSCRTEKFFSFKEARSLISTDYFSFPENYEGFLAQTANIGNVKETLNKSIYDLADGFVRQARKMARRRSIATSISRRLAL